MITLIIMYILKNNYTYTNIGAHKQVEAYVTSVHETDTPQFRGGNPYFFRENPYQSVSFNHLCIDV